VEVYDFSNVANPQFKKLLSFNDYTQKVVAATSVAAKGGNVAIALNVADGTAPGLVLVGKAASFLGAVLQPEVQVEVGYLPDMVTFTPDGKVVLVANEGEPRGDLDPEVMNITYFCFISMLYTPYKNS
jgi:2',3'-cyclic-nucleotide 2'-phosphodiesterase / 3'-nucleotidase / 5'-nucleotidase